MDFNYTSPTLVSNLAQATSVGSAITWGSNKFTVSEDGLYTFRASGIFNTIGIERAQPTFTFRVNGTEVEGAGSTYLRNTGNSFDNTANFTRTFNLTENDYVELYVENIGRTSPGTAVRCLGMVFEAVSSQVTVTGVTNGTDGATGPTGPTGAAGSTNELDGQYLEVITRSSAYGAASFEGHVVKFGTGTLVSNKSYVFTSSGWVATDADTEAKTLGLFGIALGTSPTSDGLLVRGFRAFSNAFAVGSVLYVSNAEGTVSATAPSATGEFVRVIGYAMSTQLIYIDPSQDYIELS
jgi:hypothetical protein